MRIPKTKVCALKPQTASQPTTSVVQLQVSVDHVCYIQIWKLNIATPKWENTFLHLKEKITETKIEVGVIISFVMPLFNLQIGLSILPPLIPSLQHSHYILQSIIWILPLSFYQTTGSQRPVNLGSYSPKIVSSKWAHWLN